MTYWLMLFFVTLVAELYNPGLFYFLSIACGASAAGLSALMFQTFDLQLAWFGAISALAWFVLKRIARSNRVAPYHQTNTDALLGKRALVTERIIYPDKGYVKVGGELWPARLALDEYTNQEDGKSTFQSGTVDVGESVQVIRVVGNHLVVTKYKQN